MWIITKWPLPPYIKELIIYITLNDHTLSLIFFRISSQRILRYLTPWINFVLIFQNISKMTLSFELWCLKITASRFSKQLSPRVIQGALRNWSREVQTTFIKRIPTDRLWPPDPMMIGTRSRNSLNGPP